MKVLNRYSKRTWSSALLGAVLTLFAIDSLWSQPAAQALAAARESHSLRQSAPSGFGNERASNQSPQRQAITRFHQVVIAVPHAKDWPIVLNELPSKFQLILGPVQYEHQALAPLPVSRHIAELPLTGKFVNFVAFLGALSDTLPTIAIEDIQIGPGRGSADALQFDIKLGFLVGLPMPHLTPAQQTPQTLVRTDPEQGVSR